MEVGKTDKNRQKPYSGINAEIEGSMGVRWASREHREQHVQSPEGERQQPLSRN